MREKIRTGLIHPCYVSSLLQLADLLTKGLTARQHGFLVSKLGVLDIFHFPTRGGVLWGTAINERGILDNVQAHLCEARKC